MKVVKVALVGGVVLAGTAITAQAESTWSGEAELGIVSTEGNTETQTVSGKAKAANERDKWKHEVALEALNTEDGATTTGERYSLSGKSAYKISNVDYAFGLLNYEDDRFSGYDWRASEFVGYGRKLIAEQTLGLDLEAGVGARQSTDDNGVESDEGVMRLAANAKWAVSDTAKLTEDLTSEIGEDVTITKSVTALKSQVNGSLAMKVTYTVKHVSEVPAAIEKVDRETAVTLVYSF